LERQSRRSRRVNFPASLALSPVSPALSLVSTTKTVVKDSIVVPSHLTLVDCRDKEIFCCFIHCKALLKQIKAKLVVSRSPLSRPQ
jgi:hypothetical protein